MITKNHASRSIGFDDILLVPRVVSYVESRGKINLEILAFGHKIRVPIIAAPMKDVCDGAVAMKMSKCGGMGIIHRFMSEDQQVNEFKSLNNEIAGCAIGVNGEFSRFEKLYKAGCRIFCIDVANAANIKTIKTIEKLEKYDVDLIVGNVASKECYQIIDKMPNVKAIRVGIAGGQSCTTKYATGVGYGMISSIEECASVKKKTILIADGGIKNPSDLCKAIAFGADMVMLGSIIANTSDSPAEIIKRESKWFKLYHGSASFEIQKEYKDNPKYIEGRTSLLEYDGESLFDMITRFMDGLKSSMSYFNSTNLEDFRKNITYCHI